MPGWKEKVMFGCFVLLGVAVFVYAAIVVAFVLSAEHVSCNI